MYDGYEVTQCYNGICLNPLEDDALQDLDGDGFANYVEYLAGSEPDEPNSIPNPGVYYDYDAKGRIRYTIRVQ